MKTCSHSDSSERLSVNAGVKNSQGIAIIKKKKKRKVGQVLGSC